METASPANFPAKKWGRGKLFAAKRIRFVFFIYLCSLKMKLMAEQFFRPEMKYV